MMLVKVAKVAGRGYYLGPNRNAPAMRRKDAVAAFERLNSLRFELAREIAYSMETGFGDHAKIGRLDGEIASILGSS